MRYLIRSFKTEIYPNEKQKIRINQTIGTCRYIYNFYLVQNQKFYEKEKKFVTGKEFSVWLNNEYLPENPDKNWIR